MIGQKPFGAWPMKYANAMKPLHKNAAPRVKRPMAMSRPPRNSIGPAVQMSAGGTPAGTPPNTPNIFCAP